MTSPEVIPFNPASVPFTTRWLVRIVSLIAAVLGTMSPKRVEWLLTRLRHRAQPASLTRVREIRDQVVASSLHCASREGCLRRSLTVTLLCRLEGTWATWCVGVRKIPPFAAHAWVEVDGEPVGENVGHGYHQALIRVSPTM